jgi:hypothetical protein
MAAMTKSQRTARNATLMMVRDSSFMCGDALGP